MQIPLIYDYSDYKSFLRDLLADRASVRGFQSRVADAGGCYPSYLSQVLGSSKKNLSGDQLFSIAEFLDLDGLQTEFFILLGELNRSGRSTNRARIKKNLGDLKTRANKLSSQIEAPETHADLALRAEYFSSWIYAAVHMATAVPEKWTDAALAKALDIDLRRVRGVLKFLQARELANKRGERWEFARADLYEADDSPFHVTNAISWRERAIDHLGRSAVDPERELHSSFCVAISGEDQIRLRKEILAFSKSFHKVAKPSASEVVCALNLDFFALHPRVSSR